jgi:threonine dehydrogenase-like Zn-dependent dehydrogenase
LDLFCSAGLTHLTFVHFLQMAPCISTADAVGSSLLDQTKPMDVVIVGAGPGGLLLAIYLLEKVMVSIHEAREDPREILKRPPSPRR